MKVLVAGGAGYIGSHFVHYLVGKGIETVVVDNLSKGFADTVEGIAPLVQVDIGDRHAMRDVFQKYRPDAVVDFAGLIQVGESVREPESYYQTNVVQTLSLLEEMMVAGVMMFVFSSTAAVYGQPETVPIPEDHPLRPINPYGNTKLVVEMAASDYAAARGLRVAFLRYFNAAGADPSAGLSERHHPETHLIPLTIDAALGRRGPLTVFGNDWPTEDGTAVRDYIHVLDLAEAHWLALQALNDGREKLIYNLGTGQGYSVASVIETVGKVVGRPVPFDNGPRREGDPAVLVADSSRAREELGWHPRRSSLQQIIADAYESRR